MARVVWSRIGHCAVMTGALSTLLLAGGCSTGSRFDFPSFGMAKSEDPPLADPSTTASIPTPQESVYDQGAGQSQSQQYSHQSLPPPQGYGAQPSPAAYTPVGPGFRPQQAAYIPSPAPRPKPVVSRSTAAREGGHTVKVAQGDSLYTLSKRYDVPIEAIKDANGLSDADLRLGQSLIIPGNGAPLPSKPQVAAKPGRPMPTAEATTSSPDIRVVKTTTITAPDASTQSVKLNAASSKAAAAAQPAIAASPDFTGPGASSGQSQQVASVDRLPNPEPMSDTSFRWPVQGRIVSTFGTKPDGGHNDGIDVAVPQGTSVKAAENGVVAYAGNELKGYGNLVLIRHANNWVSAYANNDEILVKRGEQVRRGQIIAKAGSSGQVGQPQVHFELRKGSRPVDPTKFMASTQASAD